MNYIIRLANPRNPKIMEQMLVLKEIIIADGWPDAVDYNSYGANT